MFKDQASILPGPPHRALTEKVRLSRVSRKDELTNNRTVDAGYDLCARQDGKKGFHDSDDEDEDDDVDFDGLFGDGAGSFVKTSPDRLASHPEVGVIFITY